MFYKSFRRCITSLAILFSAIFFVGCDSDLGGGSGYGGGSRSDNSIVGTWSYTGDGWIEKMTFKSDGQFIWYLYDEEYGEDSDTGKYTTEDNILTITWDWNENDVETYQYKISGDALTLYFEDGDGPDSFTLYRE